MKKCPYCAEEIQDEAIVCRFCKSDLGTPVPPAIAKPQAQKPKSNNMSSLTKVLLILIGSIFACLIIGSLFVSSNKPKEASQTMAYVNCEGYVKEHLKSPASAKFPLPLEVAIKSDDNVTFNIYGYVDSQNSFGAMIRNNYICIVKYDPPNDNYDLIDLKFLD